MKGVEVASTVKVHEPFASTSKADGDKLVASESGICFSFKYI